MNIETEIIELFDNNIDDTYYSEMYGFSKNITVYRNLTHIYAKIFFKLLDDLNLDYYTFAGTSIGYIRNKQNIPWVDDYDIIIFENEIQKFKNTVLPKLIEIGFDSFDRWINAENGGTHILSKFGQNCFQCDVFFTKVNEDGIIKNLADWGLYSKKNININLVTPKKYLTIDNDLTLPFFNNIQKDIELEYGDVLNTVVFHVNHETNKKLIGNFSNIYDAFNNIKKKIINNAQKLFNNHLYENNETLNDYDNFIKQFSFEENKTLNHIKFLKYIKKNNIKTLNVLDEKFLVFCPDIKFYFNRININFYMINNINTYNIIFLNYVNNIFCSKKENIDYIEKYDKLLLNKPKIDYIRVITFGTYDLFHIGHTNILKRAKNYGELFVGVSTDELNLKKGKKSINNLEIRKNDVKKSSYADYIFDEVSLELKNEYIKKYNCNLLIMGDDWKNAFNFCDCACLYLERTPEISTTMLKLQLKKKCFKICYGIPTKFIDVTNICLEKLINNNIITIPYGDLNRAKYFTDPLYGIHKKIMIQINDQKTEYDEFTKIMINTLTDDIILECKK